MTKGRIGVRWRLGRRRGEGKKGSSRHNHITTQRVPGMTSLIWNYQNGVNLGLVRALEESLTDCLWVEINFAGTGSLWVTWELKYLARPNRRFLNSTTALPDLIWVNQWDNFPTPLPIRTPLGFFEIGRWGNADTQNALFVISDFREDLFKNSFKRKIFLAEIRKGLKSMRAAVPYENFSGEGVCADRPFWRDLNLNLRGCKIT